VQKQLNVVKTKKLAAHQKKKLKLLQKNKELTFLFNLR
jgi:hypothetical protein